MSGFAVIADDLTGALVSATRLRQRGLSVAVVWDAAQLPGAASADACVVDLRSRDRPDGHYERARFWGRLLIEAGHRRLECRMDSTLRGHVRAELAGLAAAAGHSRPILLAVPAAPSAGRTTHSGIQHVHNESSGMRCRLDIAPVLFGRQADLLIDAPLIARGAAAVAGRILAARSATSPTCVIADGRSARDLSVTARAASILAAQGHPLLTVSPGEWLAHYPAIDVAEFSLVVVASPTAENAAQQTALQRLPGTVIVSPADVLDSPGHDWADRLSAGGTVVISTLTAVPGPALAAARETRYAGRAARAAAVLLDAAERRGLRCGQVVVTGGYAAQSLVDALGVPGLWPLSQVGPMCSRARVTGGHWDGMIIIAKGGQMGSAGTLASLAQRPAEPVTQSSVWPQWIRTAATLAADA